MPLFLLGRLPSPLVCGCLQTSCVPLMMQVAAGLLVAFFSKPIGCNLTLHGADEP
jgi:hypothetical protein